MSPRPRNHQDRLWQRSGPCSHCRKVAYRDRHTARRALRALYPAEAGAPMAVYRCTHGGTGWHLGHRDAKPPEPPTWPTWEDSTLDQPCQACPAHIAAGEPVAWHHGYALCLDCGDQAEQEALTA